ncbi:hypothetical protein [Sulfuriferula thiophila]|uniref:hypothetical protein n=1 Tax=Sulfuriferula thiophila TaxID=1781211 RepID=UPI000F605D9A|nr:hypothetical protein [Sulfuriferula thiophila]
MIFVPHLLIYIHAQGVSLACQRRGKFRFVGEFDADESGYQAFAAALKPFKNAKLSILVDSVDEQYHVENLPHVLGGARTEMLARRLRQISRDSAFSAAWYQGRETDGRRDDRFLFVSLNTLDWAQVWLDLLAQHHVHLALLTTVPIVSLSIARHLPQESAPLLWVTQQSGGTRLSFFHQNRLLFSRLSTPESSQAAEKLAEEIIKTRYYLTSHQYLSHQSPLAVVVLDTQQDHQRLCEILHQDTGLNLSCQVHVSDALAQRLWVNANDLHKYRDSLHLAALGRYSAAINLATPAMTLPYRQRLWQRGLYLAAVASLLMGVIAGGYLTYQRDQLTTSAMQTHVWLKQQQNSYQHILAKMPAMPTTPANLKAAVDVAKTLSAAPQPVTDFAILSEVLTRDSRINITRLVWRERNVGEPGDAQQMLVVEGEALLSQGNYQLAMGEIDRFVADLQHHPRIAKVEVISMPVNRDPKLTLHQSIQAVASTAAFKLTLLLRDPS